MFSLTSAIDQYALVPLTFADSNGPRVLPSGSVRANVVTGEGASATIIEKPDENGVLQFSAQLVTGPTPGTYKFSVTDSDAAPDTVVINILEIEYVTVGAASVDIVPGTPEFLPKSQLPIPPTT